MIVSLSYICSFLLGKKWVKAAQPPKVDPSLLTQNITRKPWAIYCINHNGLEVFIA